MGREDLSFPKSKWKSKVMLGRVKLQPSIIMGTIITFVIVIFLAACSYRRQEPTNLDKNNVERISLPTPVKDGQNSLEKLLSQRRSIRDFTQTPLDMAEIGQLLWAAQGITSERGFRTAPSAGALYPLELYVVTSDAIYHYEPFDHSLELLQEGDFRKPLFDVALRQEAICEAPVTIVITAVYERIESKYGATRSPRYVHLEAGHAAQNILLQAVSLDLGATPIGAFQDQMVQRVLGIPTEHEPLYLIPVGVPN